MSYTLPTLPYALNALEPHISQKTLEFHYGKHHQAYVNNLNKALESAPELYTQSLEKTLREINKVPESIRTAVRNNGGGHLNHSLFWEVLNPGGKKAPEGALLADINKTFGGYDNFVEKFNAAAVGRFGSGWAWLLKTASGVEIVSTPNQDTPVSEGKNPVLCCDVWEHAYYLKYQNRRPDYLAAWWNVVNWKEIEDRFNG